MNPMASDPGKRYARDVFAAPDLERLLIALRAWAGHGAKDALEVGRSMTKEDWPEFRRGLESERRGKYAGDAWAERFGAIVLPEKMVWASMSWGLAFNRLNKVARDLKRPEAMPLEAE